LKLVSMAVNAVVTVVVMWLKPSLSKFFSTHDHESFHDCCSG
jgi:hypothetical protein